MRLIQWSLASLMLLSPLGWAQSELDLAALQQFFKAGEKLEQTSAKYPELSDHDDEFMLDGDNDLLIERLKKAGALQEVNAVVKASGYESMDDYIDTTKRIMAAYFAVQLEQSPEYASAEQMRAMVEGQRKELVANGVSPELVEQMMAEVNEQLAQLDTLFAFAEKASPADTAAVRNNLDYVNRMMTE